MAKYSQKIRKNLMGITLWGMAAIGYMGTFGQCSIQLASIPFSNKVPESRVEQYIKGIADQHGFDEPIRVEIYDSWIGLEPAVAGYDEKRQENVIRLSRSNLVETVLKHETKHVVEGHVKDRSNVFKNQYNEWQATLYSIGVLD